MRRNEKKDMSKSINLTLSLNLNIQNTFKMQRNICLVTRARIVDLHEAGLNITQIAEQTAVSRSTVRRWVQRWQNENSLAHRNRPGMVPLIGNAERRIMINDYEQFGFTPTRRFAQLFGTSVWTVRRALHAEGLHHRRYATKVQLTEAHKAARLDFAREYIDYDWSSVIFSDEKTFKSSQVGRLHLWRRNNTRYEERHIVPNTQSGRVCSNMWGWISAAGPGELVPIYGRFNAARYLEILSESMLSTVRNVYPEDEYPQITFVQDNSPIHCARRIREWLRQQNIRVIPWPAKSPDLNPIENLWGLMVQRWDARNERQQEVLTEHCGQVWDSIRGTDFCESLVSSMRNRLLSVIAQNGGYTKY